MAEHGPHRTAPIVICPTWPCLPAAKWYAVRRSSDARSSPSLPAQLAAFDGRMVPGEPAANLTQAEVGARRWSHQAARASE